MKYGKLRKWNFNFRRTLSAAWIRWEHIASFSLFLTEERLLWKLTRRETGWHSSNIRCINDNLGFWIARCGFRILWCRSRIAVTGFSIPCPWNVDSRFQSLARFRASYIEQAPAVQNTDNAIHRINLSPVDSAIGFAHTYPLDSEFIRWIELSAVHLGYPLLTVFCSVALETKAGNKTWYLGYLDSFLWKCYPRKRIHCTCHLVTLNIFHWVKNLRCHLCFLPVRILDGCYFL